jgi:Glycosyl transferase family 2
VLHGCRWLGIDHIFLTDNNSTGDEAARKQLASAFPTSFLSLHSEMEPRGQLKVYAWCAEEHRASFNWMAFLDVDEFLVLRGRCETAHAHSSCYLYDLVLSDRCRPC